MQSIIFTDLDGTLLNHHDYTFHEAKEALLKIKTNKIPLIFTTSKTKAEVEVLQDKMNIKEPFIVENGAAIFFPKGYGNLNLSHLKTFGEYHILQLGKSYEDILAFYNRVKATFQIKGFSDMSIEELISLTNLPKENALLSHQRNFTEPFIIENESEIEALSKLAQKEGIKITKGGRFYHLIGQNQDKGKAVKEAINIFKKEYGKLQSIALGDGDNDIEMLLNVDIPIVIQNHKGEYITFECSKKQHSTFQSSKGWNEMVLKYV